MIFSINSSIRHNTISRNRVLRFDTFDPIIFNIIFIGSFIASIILVSYKYDVLYALWCDLISCSLNKSTTLPFVIAGMWVFLFYIIKTIYVLTLISFSVTKRRFVSYSFQKVFLEYRRKLKLLGFKTPHIRWSGVFVLLGGVILLKIILGSIFLLVMHFIIGNDAENSVTITGDGLLDNIWMGFYVILLAPMMEEIIFRGALFNGLFNGIHGKQFNTIYIFEKRLCMIRFEFKGFGGSKIACWAVILITGIIFGLIHLNNAIILLSCFGIILGWVRIATGSIWPCIILHSIWNAIIFSASLAL